MLRFIEDVKRYFAITIVIWFGSSLSLAEDLSFYQKSYFDISAVESCWMALESNDEESNIKAVHDCLATTYDISENQMNRYYEWIIQDIVNFPRTIYFKEKEIPLVDSEQLHLFIAAQEAWQQYRQRECELSVSNADDVDLQNLWTRSQWLSCMAIQADIRTESFRLYNKDAYPSPLVRG